MMDYYGLLGISRTADVKEIKEAFRKKALLHHPDKQPIENKAKATAKFKEICEAYKVLSNASQRSLYDKSGGSLYTNKSQHSAQYADMQDFYKARDYYQKQYQNNNEGYSYEARTRYKGGHMSWKDFKFKYGRYMAFQTVAACLFLTFVFVIDSTADEAWKENNKGKSFEDIMNKQYQKMQAQNNRGNKE